MNPLIHKLLRLSALLLGFYVSLRYLLPLLLPFLLGGILALSAEPMVRFGCDRLHLPRPIASGAGVCMAFAFVSIVILLLGALVFRELRELAGILPGLEGTIRDAMGVLSENLQMLAQRAPGSLAPFLTSSIRDFFSGSSALLKKITAYLLRLASGILSQMPGQALGFGTGMIASFMISAKLPKIKLFFRNRLSARWLQPALRTLAQLRQILSGWLRAQLKLSGITLCLVTVGLVLLQVPYAPLWALLIAAVDAFPIFGTGCILVPWSIISFLQANRLRAFGLLGLYAAAAVTRTALEPRLIGSQLGVDPLITLVAIYVGFRLFGLPGVILAPVVTVTVTRLISLKPEK